MRLTQEQKRRIVIVYHQTHLVDTVKEIFTKEQRREIYLKIADRFRKTPDYTKFMAKKSNKSEYLCDNLVLEVLRITGYSFIGRYEFSEVFPIFFPEFVLFKPERKDQENPLGWWVDDTDEGLAIRGDVMELCAEMCK